jgi:hypothetical protein
MVRKVQHPAYHRFVSRKIRYSHQDQKSRLTLLPRKQLAPALGEIIATSWDLPNRQEILHFEDLNMKGDKGYPLQWVSYNIPD